MFNSLITTNKGGIKFVAVLCVLCFFSTTGLAAGSSGLFNLSRVEVTEAFITVYPTTGYEITGEVCEDNTKMVFWKDDMPDGLAFVHSVALAALLAGNKVSAWVSGCKMGPWGKTLPHGHTLNIFPVS